MDIGKRIKELRVKNNLTQEELASRCELSKSFLSQLENNLTTPSLPTLMNIVEALGINMETFFKEEKNEKISFDENDYFVSEQEDYKINWIVPNAQKNSMEPIIIEIKPSGMSQVMEPHEGEEFGYVLSGRVVLVNGDQELTVKKGSTFYINGDKEHYLRNDSSHDCQVLWITNPPLF